MKVLIISHNPITTFDAMGKTMLTLFKSFKREELCQFYIYPTIPDIDKCSSYYRITDKDVLRSYYKFKVSGKEITLDQIQKADSTLFESSEDENFYRDRKNKRAIRKLLRDLMWRFSAYFNKGLKRWIEKEKPTHIFLAPGNAKFIYNVALKVAKRYNLPLITYICDEYYFVEKPKGIFNKIANASLKRKIKKTVRYSEKIITICDNLKDLYQGEFLTPAITVMTGSSFEIAKENRVKEVNSLTYLGNVRCNRYLSLCQIGKALDQINIERGKNYLLNIYTGEKDKEILSNFEGIKSINLCPFVTGEAFNNAFLSSQTLVHAESFDDRYKEVVKNSISTKIADSLCSGIPFFAYGPKGIASIDYLEKSDSAIVCTNPQELKGSIERLLDDKNLRDSVVLNAISTAKENHDGDSVGKKVYDIFNG